MKAFWNVILAGCIAAALLLGAGITLVILGQPSAPEVNNVYWSKHSEEVNGVEYVTLIHQGFITDQSGQKLSDCEVRFSLNNDDGESVWHYDEDAPFGIFNFQRRVPVIDLPGNPAFLDFECEVLSYQAADSTLPTLGIVLIAAGAVVLIGGFLLAHNLAGKFAKAKAGEDHPA